MAGLHDMAKMTVSTTGTGTFTLVAAATGFQTFAAAGAVDQETVSYSANGAAGWEVGRGVYTASSTTLTRTVLFSSNSNSAVSFASDVVVEIAMLAEDLVVAQSANQFTTTFAV